MIQCIVKKYIGSFCEPNHFFQLYFGLDGEYKKILLDCSDFFARIRSENSYDPLCKGQRDPVCLNKLKQLKPNAFFQVSEAEIF